MRSCHSLIEPSCCVQNFLAFYYNRSREKIQEGKQKKRRAALKFFCGAKPTQAGAKPAPLFGF
jgi:hypothetical protein